jgi:hypothetical protein
VIFCFYNKAGFQIKTIHCDQEFQPMMARVSDELDITMNYATADEHVSEVEQTTAQFRSASGQRFTTYPTR